MACRHFAHLSDADAVAFSLIGHAGAVNVDEPTLPALIVLATVALAIVRRRHCRAHKALETR